MNRADRTRVLLAKSHSDIALVGGTYVDPDHGTVASAGSMLINDGRISWYGPRSDLIVPGDATVVDVGGKWVIPGMIDAHVHLSGDMSVPIARRLRERRTDLALLHAATSVIRWLENGWTTVRDVGSAYGITVRTGVEERVTMGPNVVAAAPALCSTASAGDLMGVPGYPTQGVSTGALVVDGSRMVKIAVREAMRSGADFVAVLVDGLCPWDGTVFSDDVIGYSASELETIVDESHRAGVIVAATVSSAAGCAAAISAGVDTLEHPRLSDAPDELLEVLADRGTIVVPCLAKDQWIVDHGSEVGFGSADRSLSARRLEAARKSIARVLQHGVLMAIGTDSSGVFGPTDPFAELQALSDAGMGSADLLMAATANGAKACGLKGHKGCLCVGTDADVLILNRDPLGGGATLSPGDVALVIKRQRDVPVPMAML